MRRLSFFGIAVFLACFCAMPSKARAADAQTVQTFERNLTKTIGYKYLLALPDGYEPRGTRRWPLLVYLHGSGESGNDVWSVARHGPPKILKAGAPAPIADLLRKNFIVVSPQCPKNQWWDRETVGALYDELVARYRVDRQRVYLTGNSMGGFAAWDAGLTWPERFAALVPICGGGEFSGPFMANIHRRSALRALGVWAFHGARDDAVPLAESQRMIEMLKHYKVHDVKLTVYPNAEHDSWTETYENPALYQWLLRHARRDD